MKRSTQPLVLILLTLAFFAPFALHAQTTLDENAFGSVWLPEELKPAFQRIPQLEHHLLARYEPDSGAHYYVLDLVWNTGSCTAYYKVENGKPIILSKKTGGHPFPFGEIIRDPEAVDALWTDFLARWKTSLGRDTVQILIIQIALDAISPEAVRQFTRAGYFVPPDANVVDAKRNEELKNSGK